MNRRRLAGADLGIATAHTVRVLDGEGMIVAKRKTWPTVGSLAAGALFLRDSCEPLARATQ